MFKKIILFVLSPMFGVGVMVVPDAWTLYQNHVVQTGSGSYETFQFQMEADSGQKTEELAWNGDWSAIERMGANFASTANMSEWDRTKLEWKGMFFTFMAPFFVVLLLCWLLSLVLGAIDILRIKHGYYPVYVARARRFLEGCKDNFSFCLTVWMAGAYYIYRTGLF